MLTISNLDFKYSSTGEVLKKLNLRIEGGRVCGLVGYNGAGKTTLLHLLQGMLFPRQGAIDAMGFVPGNRDVAFLEQVYYVPVTMNLPLWPLKKILRVFSGFYPQFSDELFYQALDNLGIERDARLNKLSYGQQKKVQIAFGLATQARLLLLDEPTDGLDIPSKKQFRKLISDFIQDDKLVILSTHHISDVASLLDELVVLHDNTCILQISIEELSEIFYMEISPTEPMNAVFVERVIGGYQSLHLNTRHRNTQLDLEFFMRALYEQKTAILSCITQTTKNNENLAL